MKADEMLNKVLGILTEKEHVKAEELAKKCHLNIHHIYRMIKMLRQGGTGVHTTKKGYILSKYAKSVDDVNFLRRLNGRRVSDYIAISSAKSDIFKRWKTLKEQRDLQSMLAPMLPNQHLLDSGTKVLLTYVNQFGL
jgi:hypothetical protein